jgi:hypothetical protein
MSSSNETLAHWRKRGKRVDWLGKWGQGVCKHRGRKRFSLPEFSIFSFTDLSIDFSTHDLNLVFLLLGGPIPRGVETVVRW